MWSVAAPRRQATAARKCDRRAIELAFDEARGPRCPGAASDPLNAFTIRGGPMIEAQRRGDEAQLVGGPDVSANPATEPHMSELIAVRLSRRTVLVGGMAAVATFVTRGIGAPPGYASPSGRDGKGTAKA